MNKSSYNNNGKLVTTNGGNQFNNHVIHNKNNCLTGNKSPRKDRHSKINTARGPRDRRMRLSLDVAKKFFGLQDMLGFDKASNTVEWLLMKSQPDIQDLIKQKLNLVVLSNSASSGSECEVVSGIDDQFVVKNVNDEDDDKVKYSSCNKIKEKKRVNRIKKNVYFHNSLAKETREKARARARKRTTEKKNVRFGYLDQVMDQNTKRLGSWVPFEENRFQEIDQTEFDYSSMMSNYWNPSLLPFNYHHNLGSSHEHQFISDFQILAKQWEHNNNN